MLCQQVGYGIADPWHTVQTCIAKEEGSLDSLVIGNSISVSCPYIAPARYLLSRRRTILFEGQMSHHIDLNAREPSREAWKG